MHSLGRFPVSAGSDFLPVGQPLLEAEQEPVLACCKESVGMELNDSEDYCWFSCMQMMCPLNNHYYYYVHILEVSILIPICN